MSGAAFTQRYGPWAMVVGAAEGIGAAYARELAARRINLILVDRSDDKLVPPEGVETRTVIADIGDDVQAVVDAALEVDLGLLICNAASSPVGPFLDQRLDALLTQLDVNCRAALVLVHTLAPRLVARGRGGVILMSSQSAMRGAPMVASYAATKAWNLILAEGLWEELRHDNVDVLAVLPGSTRTPGWEGSDPQESLGTSNVMEPADVAVEALDALGAVPSLIVGQANRDAEAFMASLDRTQAVKIMGDTMRQMYPPTR